MVLKRGLPSKITSTKGVEKKKMGEENAPIVAATGTPDSVKPTETVKETKPEAPKKQAPVDAQSKSGTQAEQSEQEADTAALEAEIKKGVEREMMATGTADMPEEPTFTPEPEEVPEAKPAAPSFGSPTPSAPAFGSPSPFGSPPPEPVTPEPEEDTTPAASPFEAATDTAEPEAPAEEPALLEPEPVAEEPEPTPVRESEPPAAPSFGSPSPSFGSSPAPVAPAPQKDEPLPWETLPEEKFDEAKASVEAAPAKPSWELPEDAEAKPEPVADASTESNPWLKREADAAKTQPPELPTKQFSGKERIKAMAPKIPGASDMSIPPAVMRGGVTLAAIVVVGFAGYLLFFKNNEKTTEMLARWTGAYNEISQEPTLGDEQVQVAMADTYDTDAEPTFEPMALDRLQQPPEDEAVVLTGDLSPYEEAADTAGGTRIAVLSPPDAATGEDAPTDQLSMAKRLQKALQEAREKRQEDATYDPDIPTSDPVEQRRRDLTRQAELERELAEYRKTLAQTSDPTELPKPGSFFRRERGETADSNAAVYKANPKSLPLVNEPGVAFAPQVRTLDAFDVEEFAAPTRRVQIPQGVVPGLQAAEFPKLQLLSLIPNRGLIALRDGQQGVLLIGDTIQGWELTAVYQGYAEFQNRGRKYTMTLTQEIQQQGNS